jgi:hypothetical protein
VSEAIIKALPAPLIVMSGSVNGQQEHHTDPPTGFMLTCVHVIKWKQNYVKLSQCLSEHRANAREWVYTSMNSLIASIGTNFGSGFIFGQWKNHTPCREHNIDYLVVQPVVS